MWQYAVPSPLERHRGHKNLFLFVIYSWTQVNNKLRATLLKRKKIDPLTIPVYHILLGNNGRTAERLNPSM